MRQVCLFTASTFSHIAQFHRPYLRAFHEMGWEVHVACGGAAADIPEADRVILLPFEKKLLSPQNLLAQRRLRSLMREEGYALILTHTSLAAFFTRRAAAGLGKRRPPLVNLVHGYLFSADTQPLKKAVLLLAERLTAPQTDLLLTMNRWDAQAARRFHLGRRLDTVPGIGVDFSRFDNVPAGPRQAFGFAEGDTILLYAAEFSPRKNQAFLIFALPELPARVKLLLPGQGTLLESCRALAHRLGVADRVAFPGQLRDMAPLYVLADAAVTASRSEGLPFNVMEAMYAGLPVLASAVKGHTDLIEHGRTGLLFPPEDRAAFVQGVKQLLNAPAVARTMGAAAHEAVLPYGLPQVLPQVMQHYVSVLKSSEEAR